MFTSHINNSEEAGWFDKVSREDIVQAIVTAEEQLSSQIVALAESALASEARVCTHMDSIAPKGGFNALEDSVRASLAQSVSAADDNKMAVRLLRDDIKSFEARLASAITGIKGEEDALKSSNGVKASEERILAAITALQEKTKNTLSVKIEENRVDLAALKEENQALKRDNARLADHLEHISWKLKFLPFKVFVLTAASCAVSLGAADYFDYVFHFTTLAPKEGISELFSQWIYGPRS